MPWLCIYIYILVPVNVDCILFVFGVYKTKYSVTMADVALSSIPIYSFFPAHYRTNYRKVISLDNKVQVSHIVDFLSKVFSVQSIENIVIIILHFLQVTLISIH